MGRLCQKLKEHEANEKKKNEDIMNFRKNGKLYEKKGKWNHSIRGLAVNNVYVVMMKYSIWNYPVCLK